MPHSQFGGGDEWDAAIPPLSFKAGSEGWDATDQTSRTTELEPGWRAVRALMQLKSDDLLAVMLRPSFRPIRDMDLVPVAPCPHCLDGGLRMAGTVRTRTGRSTVRACDTCATLEIDNQAKSRPSSRF